MSDFLPTRYSTLNNITLSINQKFREKFSRFFNLPQSYELKHIYFGTQQRKKFLRWMFVNEH